MKTKKDNTIDDVAQALRSLASLCRHGLLTPEAHDLDDYAERLEKLTAKKKYVYVLTEIDKTNFPCTEPYDVSNWVFGSLAKARLKMHALFEEKQDEETNELHEWWAFKNSDEYEILWVIKRAKLDEG